MASGAEVERMGENKLHALRNEPVFLTAVLEQVEDAIVACNSEGVLVLFNRAARELHGMPERPIPAEEWAEYYDLYLPDGVTLMRLGEVPLFRAFRGEHVRDVEMVVAPKGGKARRLLASARPLVGPVGERLGAIAVMHDITEQKRAEEKLKRESALLRTLMESVPDAIYFKDRRSRFTRVNQHAPYRGGNNPSDVIGKTDFDFFTEEHALAAYEEEQRIMRTGQPVVDHVEKETYPDGSFTWLSTTKVPIFDERGMVTGLVGVSRDITERKLAEEERLLLEREQAARAEAEASARMKDEFLATVSHELRTPLTSILGWLYLLREGALQGEAAAGAVATIERAARAQARLVDDLLDVSRIITGNLRLDVRQVDAGHLLESVTEALGPSAEVKEIRIERSIEAGETFVSGDPARLQQVVWNLLSNAIKFTPRGGVVRVGLRRRGASVEMEVSDAGEGISAEFLPHLFERFRQADQGTARRHGGMGLGLAIVRHLVELHGGTVEARSAGESQGSTFTVLLPAADSGGEGPAGGESASAAAPEGGGQPERLDGVRVLFVDDDPDTRQLLKAGLEQFGAAVTTAGSAAEALEAIRAGAPDLLISDIGMPCEDGYQLIGRVRGLPPEEGGEVPAIALTAYARDEDRERALGAGYQAHVRKPVELPELVAAAARLVKRGG